MGKSFKSKWKRKMRAIKRVRCEEKVLTRLKAMLALHETKENEEEAKKSVEMADTAEENKSNSEEIMEVETSKSKSKDKGKITLRGKDGKYPAWMTDKKIARHARKARKSKMRAMRKKHDKGWKLANKD